MELFFVLCKIYTRTSCRCRLVVRDVQKSFSYGGSNIIKRICIIIILYILYIQCTLNVLLICFCFLFLIVDQGMLAGNFEPPQTPQ